MKKISKKRLIIYGSVFGVLCVIFFSLNSIIALFLPQSKRLHKVDFSDYEQLKQAYTWTSEFDYRSSSIFEEVSCSGWVFSETDSEECDKAVKLIIVGEKGAYSTNECTTRYSTVQNLIGEWKTVPNPNNSYFIVEFSTIQLPDDIYEIYIYDEENSATKAIVDSGLGFIKNSINVEEFTKCQAADVLNVSEGQGLFDKGWINIYYRESSIYLNGWESILNADAEDNIYFLSFVGDNGETATVKCVQKYMTDLVSAVGGVQYIASGFAGSVKFSDLPDSSGIVYVFAENSGKYYRTVGNRYEIP